MSQFKYIFDRNEIKIPNDFEIEKKGNDKIFIILIKINIKESNLSWSIINQKYLKCIYKVDKNFKKL